MKLTRIAFLAAALMALDASAQPAPQPTPTPPPPTIRPGPPGAQPNRMPPNMAGQGMNMPPAVMPDRAKLSYAVGAFFAGNIKRDHIDVDPEAAASAFRDVLSGKPATMTDEEVKETIGQLSRALPQYVANFNKTNGEAYLAKNGKIEGVKTLPNGMQYKVLKEGTGEMPKTNDTVTVSYKGTLVDGTVFDHNDHFTTPVTGRTIKGWSEILPMMKVGSKWEVTIPSDLAYGARGTRDIRANAVLIFEMELLSVSPPPPPPAPATNVPAKPVVSNASTIPPGTPGAPPVPPSATTTPVVSGQIIKVPSAEELKKGAKIEVITNVPNQ